MGFGLPAAQLICKRSVNLINLSGTVVSRISSCSIECSTISHALDKSYVARVVVSGGRF